MNNEIKSEIKICSSKDHIETIAIIYCKECNKYLCHKCEKSHSKIFKTHHKNILEENIKLINDLCKENNHLIELNYFCISHNTLCCESCLNEKNNKIGIHIDCNIYTIEEIKDKKKNILKENINNLKKINKTIIKSIDELKGIYENYKRAKNKIQSIFIKIRNAANIREKELLKELDEQYKTYFFDESFVKESNNLPDEIKKCLENCRKIKGIWNKKNKFSSFINDYTVNEKKIKEINKINDKIIKYISCKNKIVFNSNKNEIKNFIQKINNIGNVKNNFDNEDKMKKGFDNKIGLSKGSNIPINYHNQKINYIGNIKRFIEEKIKKGFNNIVGFRLGSNIPINYTISFFEENRNVFDKKEDKNIDDELDIINLENFF